MPLGSIRFLAFPRFQRQPAFPGSWSLALFLKSAAYHLQTSLSIFDLCFHFSLLSDSASVVTLPFLTWTFPSPFYKDPRNYTRFTWINQNNSLSVTSVKFFLPLRQHIHRFQGLECGHLWGWTLFGLTWQLPA